ncbi:hypothetical protein ACFY0A_24930 [Streptomyces sp. NPDC001698]|uniref:hypothetical protein n=1 Tax=Streptomyces sp. NPDC001698 TaxID=3364601 RepID=UPI003698D5BA
MELYLAVPLVLVALLVAAMGVAAVTRGWVPPWNRRQVRRVRLYGRGQLILAVALCLQAFRLVTSNPAIRSLGALFGSGLLLAGIFVTRASFRAGGNRQGSGTAASGAGPTRWEGP